MHVVIGCNGPVGLTLMRRLHGAGVRVRGICRSGRAYAPAGVEVVAADAADGAVLRRLCSEARIVYGCIGLPYTEWVRAWPPIVDGLLVAAEGRRLVFADNLYAYGPQDRPLREDMTGTRHGRKPALRARLAERMLEAHRTGQSHVALVRASDFYGPEARNAILGERVFAAALKGKPAQLPGGVDQPHAYTYVPDFARALATLADAPDDAYGRAWHVPNAPPRTTREIVVEVYRLAGRKPQVQVLPKVLLPLLSLVSPLFRELREMQFQMDRPYHVDHTDFASRFWGDATPFEEGLAATLDWYRRAS